MSTIKTTNIQHPSAASPNLTLAADGSVSGGAGLGGLVHIATESFSGVSSVSFDGCFSASFDNYRLVGVVRFDSTTNATNLNWRGRTSGTDNSTASYRSMGVDLSNTGGPSRTYTTAQTFGVVSYGGNGSSAFFFDLFSPWLSIPYVHGLSMGIEAATNDEYTTYRGTQFYSTASFDGITLYPGSGTFTGSISVYGYANS